MNIIIRQQRGGFVARFDSDSKFAKLGKSRGDAIANLVEANKKRLGIDKVSWDMKDNWTRNYVQGKTNRSVFPKPDIKIDKLPKVSSVDEAKALAVAQTYYALPMIFVNCLRRTFDDYNLNITLGELTTFSEQDLVEKASRNTSSRKFGEKNMAKLKKLLSHYGLSLKQ